MTDPDVPGPSDPYLREHLHWYEYIYIECTNITTKLIYKYIYIYMIKTIHKKFSVNHFAA